MNTIVTTVSSIAIASSLLVAGGDIVPVEPLMPEVVVSDSWEYSASVYLWGSAIGGATIHGEDIDIPFSDIIAELDFAYMGTLAAKKGKWTFGADVIYLKVGTTLDGPILEKFQLKSWIITPYAAYNVLESDQWNIDLLGGARYLYTKPQITLHTIGSVAQSDTNWDGIVGIKGNYKLNEKWFMPIYFDIGAGDSDLTWQAFAGVGYKYENFDVVAGYRYLEYDFDDNDPYTGALTGLDFSGLVIGARVRF